MAETVPKNKVPRGIHPLKQMKIEILQRILGIFDSAKVSSELRARAICAIHSPKTSTPREWATSLLINRPTNFIEYCTLIICDVLSCDTTEEKWQYLKYIESTIVDSEISDKLLLFSVGFVLALTYSPVVQSRDPKKEEYHVAVGRLLQYGNILPISVEISSSRDQIGGFMSRQIQEALSNTIALFAKKAFMVKVISNAYRNITATKGRVPCEDTFFSLFCSELLFKFFRRLSTKSIIDILLGITPAN